MSEWISVKDKLPSVKDTVLVFSRGVHIADFRPETRDYYWDCDTYGLCESDVAYWMPLPAHPIATPTGKKEDAE